MISTNVKNKINTHNNRSNNFSTTLSLRTYSNKTNNSPGNISKDPIDNLRRFSFWGNNLKNENNDLVKTEKTDSNFENTEERFFDKMKENGHILICDTHSSVEKTNEGDLSNNNMNLKTIKNYNEKLNIITETDIINEKFNDNNHQVILADTTSNNHPRTISEINPITKDNNTINDNNRKKSFEKKNEAHSNTQKLFPTYVINIAKPFQNKLNSAKNNLLETKLNLSQNFYNNNIHNNEDKFTQDINSESNKDYNTSNKNLLSSNKVNTSNNIIITINNYEYENNQNYQDRVNPKESAKILESVVDHKKKIQLNVKKTFLKQLSKISERSNMINKESDNSLEVGSKKNTLKNLKELTRDLRETDIKLSNGFKYSRSSLFKLTTSKKDTLNSNRGEINEYFTDSEGLSETEKEEEIKRVSEIKSSSDSDSDLLEIPNTLKISNKEKKDYFTDFINKTPESHRTFTKMGTYKSHSFSRPNSSLFLTIINKNDKLNKSMSKEEINFKYNSDLDKKLFIEKQKFMNECTYFIINKVKTHIANDFIFSKMEEILNKIRTQYIFRLFFSKLNSTKKSIPETFWEGKSSKSKFDNRVSLKLSNKLNKRYFNIRKQMSKNNFFIFNDEENENSDNEKNLLVNFTKKINKRSINKQKVVKIQKLCTYRNFNPKKISHASSKLQTQNTMRYPIQTKGSSLELHKCLKHSESKNKVFQLNISNIAYCDKFLQLDVENYLLNINSDQTYVKAPSLEKLTSFKDTSARNTEKDDSKNFNLYSRRTSLNIVSSKNLERPFDVHDKVIGFNNLSKKTFTLGTRKKLNTKSSKVFIKKNENFKNKIKCFQNFSVLEDTKFFDIVNKQSIHKKRKKTHLNNFHKLLSIRRVQQDINKSKQGGADKIPTLNCKEGEMLNKECMMNRTHEIKSNLVNRLKNPMESLKFYMKDDNFAKFKEILGKNKSMIEQKDGHGNTLLNLAAQYNSPDVASFLIETGADVNTQNNKMNTPLHYALSHKNFRMADILITRGAREDTINSESLTPWQCLARAQMNV